MIRPLALMTVTGALVAARCGEGEGGDSWGSALATAERIDALGDLQNGAAGAPGRPLVLEGGRVDAS